MYYIQNFNIIPFFSNTIGEISLALLSIVNGKKKQKNKWQVHTIHKTEYSVLKNKTHTILASDFV